MAILKFGVIVTGARGTIAGTTLSANKAGPYAKAWAPPPKSTSTKQSAVQGLFGALRNGWRALTAGERADWDTFAALPGQAQTNALGETYYLSGWQWYCKLNGWRFQPYDPAALGCPVIDPPLIDAPPAGSAATAPTLTGMTAVYTAPTTVTLAFSAPVLAAGEYLLVEAMPIYSPSQLYAPPGLRALWAFENGDTTPVTLTDTIDAAFGSLTPNSQFLLRAYLLPVDGYRSAAAQIIASTEA
jgi:hypothetical protein